MTTTPELRRVLGTSMAGLMCLGTGAVANYFQDQSRAERPLKRAALISPKPRYQTMARLVIDDCQEGIKLTETLWCGPMGDAAVKRALVAAANAPVLAPPSPVAENTAKPLPPAHINLPASPLPNHSVASSNTAPVTSSNNYPSASTFVKLAVCESTSNWQDNTGNGFYGGLQFTTSTWNGYGGNVYAPRADLATEAQQITIAQVVQHSQGWGAWPNCSKALGLR